MDWLKLIVQSKRFQATVASVLFVVLSQVVGPDVITEEATIQIVGLVAAWIVSDGLRGLEQ